QPPPARPGHHRGVPPDPLRADRARPGLGVRAGHGPAGPGMGAAPGARVGVVGTGWMAETHTEALRRLGIDVAGVGGRTPAPARGGTARPRPAPPPATSQ